MAIKGVKIQRYKDWGMWGFDVDVGPVSFCLGRLASGGLGISSGLYVGDEVLHLEISTVNHWKFETERA